MHAPLAREAGQTLGQFEDLGGVLVARHELAEIPRLDEPLGLFVVDVGERNVLPLDCRGEGLRHPLPHFERIAEHPRRILERLLGFDRSESHHLGDLLSPVLLLDVLDDLPSPALVEIDVDVGHRNSFRIEEPLEEQAVANRVELRDLQGVGHHRPGAGAASGPHSYPVALGPQDVVGDDEEVPGEAHLQDDAHLVVGALAHVGRNLFAEAHVQAAVDLLDEPRGEILAFGDWKDRHVVRALVGRGEGDVAALGDEQGVLARPGKVAEEFVHFLGGAQVVARAVEGEAVRVLERRTGVDAQHRVLDGRVTRLDVMRVVRRDQRGVDLSGKVEKLVAHALFDGVVVVHDLDVVVLLAEQVLHAPGGLVGFVELPEAQPRLNFAGGASCRGDEPLVVRLQKVHVHPRPLAHLAFERGARVHAEKVVKPPVVVGQKRQVRVGAARGDVVGPLALLAPEHPVRAETGGSRRHVRFDADDRLDPLGLALFVKLVGPEAVPVVRDRHGLLVLGLGLGHELLDLHGPVEHRVFGVDVQMREVFGHGPSLRGASVTRLRTQPPSPREKKRRPNALATKEAL